MTTCWYIVDARGWRRIDVATTRKGEIRWDCWSGFRAQEDASAWPDFAQFAVRAPAAQVREALQALAAHLDLTCEEITHQPEAWADALFVTEERAGAQGVACLVGEPRRDRDERLVASESAELFFEALGADGAFFGHATDTGTLSLSVFRAGQLEFDWRDSLQPGPHWALTITADGRAVTEDPRTFALNRQGLPPTSPLLDRYAFVEQELAALGLPPVSPMLAHRPINAAFRIAAPGEHLHDAPGIRRG